MLGSLINCNRNYSFWPEPKNKRVSSPDETDLGWHTTYLLPFFPFTTCPHCVAFCSSVHWMQFLQPTSESRLWLSRMELWCTPEAGSWTRWRNRPAQYVEAWRLIFLPKSAVLRILHFHLAGVGTGKVVFENISVHSIRNRLEITPHTRHTVTRS